MAKKTEAQGESPEGVLVKAAKKVGKAAGKIVAAVDTAPPVEAPPAEKPQTKSVKVPKFAKKNKQRLPRKEKKAQQKAAAKLQ
jgi:hypothetical protein